MVLFIDTWDAQNNFNSKLQFIVFIVKAVRELIAEICSIFDISVIYLSWMQADTNHSKYCLNFYFMSLIPL